jgi:hypothetical protein
MESVIYSLEKHEKMPSQAWFKGKSQDTLDIVDYLMAKKKWCRFLFLSCPLKLNSLIEQISKKNVKVKANDPPLSSFDSLSQQRLQRCLAPCPSMSHVAWRG